MARLLGKGVVSWLPILVDVGIGQHLLGGQGEAPVAVALLPGGEESHSTAILYYTRETPTDPPSPSSFGANLPDRAALYQAILLQSEI